MKFFDRFRRKTPLQLALQRGITNGDLRGELRELGDIVVKSRPDAEAICDVLAAINRGEMGRDKASTSALHAVVGLFQEVEGKGCDAFPVLKSRGLPLIQEAAGQALVSDNPGYHGEVLFMLKILAMYGTQEGVDFIIHQARQGVLAEDWLWSVILGVFSKEHSLASYVFSALSHPLPEKFIAVSLLDGANQFVLDGGELRHPFDSDDGMERLAAWLFDSNTDHFSYAASAVVALPFVEHSRRMELLGISMQHPSPKVRLEGAWAAAKLGEESGLRALATMCLDINLSEEASRYLNELNRPDMIPAAAREPDFVAKADFAQWLAHPNELGRPPDELDIYDHRTLRWPPDFTEHPVWLLRYVVRQDNGLDPDDVGIGMVGTGTWCFFSYKMEQRPPEDIYALHCYWGLEDGQIAMHDVEAQSTEYDELLAQWTGPVLDGARIEHVAELETVLRHPRKLLAVAGGKQNGVEGWVVLDGPDSRWYAAEDFPDKERSKEILKIHIGRNLLGFSPEAERKKWLCPRPAVPDAQIIAAYEGLIDKAASLPEEQQTSLFSEYDSPLGKHFDTYVDAVVREHSLPKASVIVKTYESILALVEKAVFIGQEKAYDSFSFVGKQFDSYAEAIIEMGRGEEVLLLVRKFLPLWQHNLGYRTLGEIAFKAGDHVLAEELLLKLKNNYEQWPRSEEMAYLAAIWHRRGDTKQAHDLLVDCLRYTLAEAAEATGSDIQFHENIYQRQREEYGRIFGNTSDLDGLGLPESTLK